MLQKKNILFDLDGTLINSMEGITRSVQYALKKMNVDAPPREQLTNFIGPALHDSFPKYYGFTAEQTQQAIAFYREYFRDKGLFQNQLYDGIPQLIKDLASSGKTLAVATTKPEIYARQILDDFKLSEYFAYIAGSELSGERSDKAMLIRYAMKQAAMERVEDSVMVGDTRFDIIGANKLGMTSVGVLYGFGSKEELEQNNPTYLAVTTKELRELLLP